MILTGGVSEYSKHLKRNLLGAEGQGAEVSLRKVFLRAY
jgi:hypothetical protein